MTDFSEHCEYEACWRVDDWSLFQPVSRFFVKEGFDIIQKKQEYRRFVQFFDTRTYDFARRNWTLREIRKPEKFDFRYDYKTGQGDSRVERQYRSKKRLTSSGLSKIFKISSEYLPLRPVIETVGQHKKTFFSKEGLVIELKEDEIREFTSGKVVVRDAELEFKKGKKGQLAEFYELVSQVESNLNLQHYRQSLQKYTRIALKERLITLESLVSEIA